jgi:hypothetical protein
MNPPPPRHNHVRLVQRALLATPFVVVRAIAPYGNSSASTLTATCAGIGALAVYSWAILPAVRADPAIGGPSSPTSLYFTVWCALGVSALFDILRLPAAF